MGEATKIEWCDRTWSPWFGCTNVSPACDHCYAEAWAKRSGIVEWGAGKPRRLASADYWKRPVRWNKEAAAAGKRLKVFPSLCDPFDAEVSDDWRDDLFGLIVDTPRLNWLLLTKRPQVALKYTRRLCGGGMPDNVWLGTTVENQAMADLRIPTLLDIPAKVHFLSCEPLLEKVTLRTEWMMNLDWVIIGGESGPRCRPTPVGAFERLRDQCRVAGIWFFAKQLGGHPNKRDRLEDFPEALRVREFPA